MNDGKPTGPKGMAPEAPVPGESVGGDGSVPGEPVQGESVVPGATDVRASGAVEGSGDGEEPYPLAPGQPVEDESAYRLAPPAPAEPVHEPAPAEPAPADEPASARPAPAAPVDEPVQDPALPEGEGIAAPRQPLHDPDPYGTPPYGGPGPWAPAPPVQLPAPPAGSVPPQGAYPAPEAPAPYPVPEGVPPVPPSSQWVQYDPWGAAGQPLTTAGVPRKRKPRRGGLVLGAVVLALVAGGIGGGVGAYIERTGATHVDLPQAGKGPTGRAPDSVAGIAASALPGVVTLHVSGESESGTGTGFVLDNAGHILTNNHVVEPAGSSGDISVTFSGGETARATVVGRDSGYDLAVVRVTGVSGLKPLPLGNSDNVQVGDPVVAIGAPFDLSNTVTSGIISAKERPITAGGEKGDGSDVSYVDALQTDAPINPGNSGGPLLDSRAHVVGINSAIRAAGNSDSGGQGGSIGLGFAIPVNQGKRVAEELINTGKATHPVIGVTLDMKFTGDGARVGAKAVDGKPSVTPGGPGATAGIKPEDVITKVDGQRVHSAEELIVKIRSHRPGDRLELTLKRGGREQRLTLTLGSATS
ncbi:trypsin-like peptidase domain-containing protein [Streptomyces sp. BPTC-684]|uniref:S1C family serine protease n=1 Tax=Streptomyces sp. BPTC-684 TaxID=3043734 RepID=UPI0024B131A6|nr:trypsin-like peptidase domain-containing protein [Streptomyces sp. BPTC-684]WHM36769.1 trypsin-like peptidase domain-containing protein [Streptomyces sp. BPTC-684]